MRYANRVPLLYQQSACVSYKAVLDTTWRNYGLTQSRGALPSGPMVIFVHMASVWVPFTSESKEAIAEYDEVRKEILLALRECGRRLGAFLRRRERAHSENRRRNIFDLYIEEVVDSCNRLKGGQLPDGQAQGAAPEDGHAADRRREDRRAPGQERRRAGGAAVLDHRHPGRRRGGGAGAGQSRRRRRSRPLRGAPDESAKAVHAVPARAKAEGQAPRREADTAPRAKARRPARATSKPARRTTRAARRKA